MIKALILVAIVCLTTALGVLFSANKKKRMQVFAELYEFNEQLLLNLKFSKVPLAKVAEPYKFVPSVIKGEKVLSGKDGETLAEYIVNLGKSDASSQVDYLNGRKAQLSKLKEDSAADYKKYSSLYIKIFFMAGVLMAVLRA